MIYVLKTSVKTKRQCRLLRTHLNEILPEGNWNFDLEDCDNILRIESNKNILNHIIQLLNNFGYLCEELN